MSCTEIIGLVAIGLLIAFLMAIAYAIAFLVAYRYAEKLPKEEQNRFWFEFNMRLWEDEQRYSNMM